MNRSVCLEGKLVADTSKLEVSMASTNLQSIRLRSTTKRQHNGKLAYSILAVLASDSVIINGHLTHRSFTASLDRPSVGDLSARSKRGSDHLSKLSNLNVYSKLYKLIAKIPERQSPLLTVDRLGQTHVCKTNIFSILDHFKQKSRLPLSKQL